MPNPQQSQAPGTTLTPTLTLIPNPNPNPSPDPTPNQAPGAPGWAETQKFRQCLPKTLVPEPATGGKGGDNGPSCSANPGCANLVGECCPTYEGMLLA